MKTFHCLAEKCELIVCVLQYLPPLEIYKFQLLDKTLYSVSENDTVWSALFSHFFGAQLIEVDETLRLKLYRPTQERAIGRRVKISQPNGIFKCGEIVDFRLNQSRHEEYLVSYNGDDSTTPKWEVQYRWHDRDHMFGVSRFEFMECTGVAEEISTRINTSSIGRIKQVPTYSTWRQQYAYMTTMLPAEHVLTIQIHTDEVLFVEFNNRGDKLATCSRDGTVTISQLSPFGTIENFAQTEIEGRHDATTMRWSPDDAFLMVATVVPFNTGGEIVILSAALNYYKIACIRCQHGSFLCPWIEDNTALISKCVRIVERKLVHKFVTMDFSSLRGVIKKKFEIQCTEHNTIQLCELVRLPHAAMHGLSPGDSTTSKSSDSPGRMSSVADHAAAPISTGRAIARSSRSSC